jgi:hypothetical protein
MYRENAIAEYADVAKHLNADGYVTRTGARCSAVQVIRIILIGRVPA